MNDPSGNLSSIVTRQVEVEDTRAPVVKLYGLNPMYVDLEAILNEESRYSNPGAYAIENLFVDGTGLFDWDTEDENLAWSVSYELCNDLEDNTYDAPVISSEDQIAKKIQGYIDDPSTAPVDVIRYRVTYSLTDKAGNVGEANRTVEIRGSPNKFPHINFSFDQNGVPSSSNISGQIAFLTEATPWVVEVGEDQYDSVPDADVYNQLASGVTETIQYNTEIIFLDGNGNEQAKPSLANDLSKYLTKVNYWDPSGSDPQYVLFDENQNQYTKYSNTATDWRRVVIRYTSVENGFGNKSIRDLEVRLVDTKRPEITLSADALTVEAGEPFEDPEDFPNLNVTDLAGSSISVDREISLGSDVNATFDELAERGFWEIGTATITYSAEDEFGNEALEKVVTVTVNDTTAPHVALVRNGFGNSPINSFSVLDLNFSGSIPNGVDPYSIFQGSGGDTRINDKLSSLNYTSSAPYIDTNGNTDIILKASEYDSFQVTGSIPSSAEKITLADNNDRSYVLYSPFKIILSDGSEVQDPGILVYEASNQNLTFTPNVSSPEYFDNSNQQIRSISVSVTVHQQNGYSTTSPERTYTFEDDIKPTIDPIADTDGSNTFVLVEAGTTYSDTNGTYFLWENGAKGASVSSTVSVTDLADDELGRDINLQRRYFNESNVELNSTDLTPGKPDYTLGAKYKIQYDATDSEGNDADSVYRWLIVQDTTAPDIDYTVPSSNIFEINSTSSVVNDENDTIEHILTSLSFTATDAYNFDQDLSVSSNKWEVTFDPPFQPDTIYPYDRSDSGYTVTVRVKDSSDNYSEPKEFELKIGDYNAPVITFIGEQEIHDFLRYGETNGSLANQNLFEDQPTSPDNPEYNATGFSGGAHRIIISDYSFVDPGVFAEDESFNISDNSYPLYPDLDGDNRGESYAIKRVTNEDDMENPAEAGIIYAYSHLNTMTLAAYQSAAVDGFPVTDPGPTDPNATVIPDFDGDSNNDLIDVHKVTIKYRVKDGWENISDIKERRVYIYISKQYANSAFYATPLYTKDGQPFSDLYDANRTTFGQTNPFLTSLQKDYDGDGVSDYWENIFGTLPDDASDNPNSRGINLADPASYRTSSLSQIPNIP